MVTVEKQRHRTACECKKTKWFDGLDGTAGAQERGTKATMATK